MSAKIVTTPAFPGRLRAELALLGVAGAWGLTFPLIREALGDVAPLHFLALRFWTAMFAFLPVLLLLRVSWAMLRAEALAGLLLGAVAFISYVTQTIGLRTVPAGRAAFITGLGVVMVPLLGPLFRTGKPGVRSLVSATVAMVGLYLLSEPASGGLTPGDLWVLGCAAGYALYIQLLQRLTTRADGSPARRHAPSLAFFQTVGLAICATLLLPFAPSQAPRLTVAVLVAVLFCAVVATVLTFLLQVRYQQETTASRAALIFASEPVFAALFACLLLAETLSFSGLVGGALVLCAIVIGQSSKTRGALPPTPELHSPGHPPSGP